MSKSLYLLSFGKFIALWDVCDVYDDIVSYHASSVSYAFDYISNFQLKSPNRGFICIFDLHGLDLI